MPSDNPHSPLTPRTRGVRRGFRVPDRNRRYIAPAEEEFAVTSGWILFAMARAEPKGAVSYGAGNGRGDRDRSWRRERVVRVRPVQERARGR